MNCVPANSAERNCMWEYSVWGYFEEEDERSWFKCLKKKNELPKILNNLFKLIPSKDLTELLQRKKPKTQGNSRNKEVQKAEKSDTDLKSLFK